MKESIVGDNRLPEWAVLMNDYGAFRVPFLFLIDFEMKDVYISQLDQIGSNILYRFGSFTNERNKPDTKPEFVRFDKTPMPYSDYENAFIDIQKEIRFGNTFLLNLTFPTPISTNLTLEEIYWNTSARFKMLWKDQFTFFSPERFVLIKNNKIYSNPMKGTIDASIPNAEKLIMEDPKEMAEHFTIVDLIRNDLSRVSNRVSVERFRYVEKIATHQKELLQVSSEIVGHLSGNYYERLGSIFFNLLPAGSISGAPKDKTVEIIQRIEGQKRGYYTGVFGIFDGVSVDSAVCIRFIEKIGEQLMYRSGCGLTHQSDPVSEYQEMVDKVYLPV